MFLPLQCVLNLYGNESSYAALDIEIRVFSDFKYMFFSFKRNLVIYVFIIVIWR